MKENEEMSITSTHVVVSKKTYVSPKITSSQIDMEHGIAAGSVENSMKSSWSTEELSQDLEFHQ